ncbi:MAG: polysaccharide biosynthesis/export family protein [Planctomycetota bacterium]
MDTQLKRKFRIQFSLGSTILVMLAFSAGFLSRNLIDGLSPLYLGMSVPASTSLIGIGETLSIESLTDPNLNREVVVLSDATIKLPLVGIVDVKDQTTIGLEKILNKKFAKYYKQAGIEVFRSSSSSSK